MNFSKTHIDKIPLVFFDFETTGLSANNGDRVCEIGAVKILGNEEIERFSTFVYPERNIPARAFAVHGISDEDVEYAPSFVSVAGNFVKFLKGCVLCAYNIGFDLSFLNSELNRLSLSCWQGPYLDILIMARKVLPGLYRYKLAAVAESLNIENIRFHRALDDAIVTKDVFLHLKSRLLDADTNSLEQFISLCGGC